MKFGVADVLTIPHPMFTYIGIFVFQIWHFLRHDGHKLYSIGSLGANNSWAHVSDVLAEKATLLGTTNGVRIKTWQVMHDLLA